jgi:glutathione S-transferase
MLTLYHSPLMPTCRKVRLMLREKNVPHELKTELFWMRRIEFFKLNPAGEVPVLVTEKGLKRELGEPAMSQQRCAQG